MKLFFNKKDNRKAFTLIELLAVIVILAAIALITTPIILGIIENSRRNAFLASAYGIIDAAKHNYSRAILQKKENDPMYYTYTNSIESSSTSSPVLEYNGQRPVSGNVYVDNKGGVAIAIYNGKWCATKSLVNNEVQLANLSQENCIVIMHPTCVTSTDYDFDVATKTIVDYTGVDTNVIIPQSFNVNNSCYNVETIGDSAFYDKGLTEASIPDTVKTIADSAFNGNLLTTVKLPLGIENIGAVAFSDNLIETIEFTNTLKTIGSEAFINNRIQKLVLPDSLTTLGSGAFNDNQISELSTGNGLTKIAGEFDNNFNISKLEIGTSVTSIEQGSFSNVTFNDIYIPSTVVDIKDGAFYYTSINNLTIDAQNINSGTFSGATIGKLTIQSGTKIVQSSFDSATINSIDVNSKDLQFSGGAFSSVSPTTASIKCKAINGSILTGSSQITNLTISGLDTPVTIASGAFNGRNIATLNINNASIGSSAFGYGNIGTVVLNNATFTGTSSFSNSNIASLTLTNIGSIPDFTFSGNNLTSVLIPNSVTSIGLAAFYDNLITQGNAKIDNSSSNVTLGNGVFDGNGADGTINITPTFLR